MATYPDQMEKQNEPSLSSLIDGIASSRNRIEENTSKIYAQLERLGFHKPAPLSPAPANGPALGAVSATPRERTALEALEHQAVYLRNEADRVEQIAYLLNNQF